MNKDLKKIAGERITKLKKQIDDIKYRISDLEACKKLLETELKISQKEYSRIADPPGWDEKRKQSMQAAEDLIAEQWNNGQG